MMPVIRVYMVCDNARRTMETMDANVQPWNTYVIARGPNKRDGSGAQCIVGAQEFSVSSDRELLLLPKG